MTDYYSTFGSRKELFFTLASPVFFRDENVREPAPKNQFQDLCRNPDHFQQKT